MKNYIWSITGIAVLLLVAFMAEGCKKMQVEPGPVMGTVKDIDGNSYLTIKIGNQVWMMENLKTTRFNDGTAILLADTQDLWSSCYYPDSLPCYCWLENDQPTYGEIFGALYNGFAARSGKLCPAGWHVPTDAEWQELEKFVGMSQEEAAKKGYRGTQEGAKLRELGTIHWKMPNTGATNAYWFTARPGCQRNSGGYFTSFKGEKGLWWTSSVDENQQLIYREMRFDNIKIARYGIWWGYGHSVRCLMD